MRITLVDSTRPELAPWVIGYVGGHYAERGQPGRRVIPARPNCFIQIVLDGGHSLYDVVADNTVDVPRAALFGPLTHYRYDMVIPAGLKTFCVRLQPAAAGQLFGLEPLDLVDALIPLDLPPGLLASLLDAPDWTAMAPPADCWLSGLARGKNPDDPVAREANRLRQMRGTVSIQELAQSAGLSLRHFQRRFRELTGLNPKHYGRICRIGHAVHRKELEPEASWTALALEAGYADQPHFIRDFKELTGISPGAFLRGQSPIMRYPKWDE